DAVADGELAEIVGRTAVLESLADFRGEYELFAAVGDGLTDPLLAHAVGWGGVDVADPQIEYAVEQALDDGQGGQCISLAVFVAFVAADLERAESDRRHEDVGFA